MNERQPPLQEDHLAPYGEKDGAGDVIEIDAAEVASAAFDFDAGEEASAPAPRRGRQLLVIRLIPNLISILALCCGLTAIRYAVEGRIGAAVMLIVVAAFLDGIDGRLARMLRSESAIGAELDSLCDFVNFGVVPGLVIYMWGLQAEHSFGWIAVLIYAVCCMLRLARFNVGSRKDTPAETSSFIGVPSPAGALLALMPIYFVHVTGIALAEELVALWMVGMGVLMISRLRTPSFKRLRIEASWAPFVLVGAVAAIAAMATYPWSMLLALSWLYIALLLWAGLQALRKRASRE